MQVITSNLLNLTEELPAPQGDLIALKSGGFTRLRNWVASNRVTQLKRLSSRFETLRGDEREALLYFEADLTKVPHKDFVHKLGVPSAVVAEAIVARTLGLTEMTVCCITRSTGVEWALVGDFSDGQERRTFLIGRWGEDLEPLEALVIRVRLERRREAEQKKQAAAAAQDKSQPKQHSWFRDWLVPIILVGGVALSLWLFVLADNASTTAQGETRQQPTTSQPVAQKPVKADAPVVRPVPIKSDPLIGALRPADEMMSAVGNAVVSILGVFAMIFVVIWIILRS